MPTRNRTDHPTETLLLLRALREVGAMDALTDRAGTATELAAETPLSPAAAERVLDVLADLGFVAYVDGEYETTNRALGFLAKRDLRSIGSLPRELDVADDLVDLPSTLATYPERVPESSVDGDDDRLRNRLGAELATDPALVRAYVTAAIREARSADRVRLMDDGAGTYAREFVARGLEATVLTDPDVAAVTSPLLDANGVETTAGPPSSTPPTDLVFGVDLLAEMHPEEARMTVEAVADLVTADGAAVLVEPVRDRLDGDVVTAFDARRLALGAGRCYAESTVTGWFENVGLRATVRSIPSAERVAIVGRPERAVLED